jgi:CheY-like chemotaxis protein/class 3 adenylate cyclase
MNINERVFLAYSIEAIANNICKICESYGVLLTKLKQDTYILQELIEGRFTVLFLEYGYLESINKKLIQQIRQHKKLEDLFIVVYGPSQFSKENIRITAGCNVLLQAPFTEQKLLTIFKRAFSLSKQILFLTPNPKQDFVIALEKMGYDVSLSESAEDTLSDKSPQIPDYIIAEYFLSGMNGLEFHYRKKDSERLKDIPFMLAYTGRNVNDIEAIIKANVNDIILSPYSSATNLKKIQDLIPLPPKGKRLRALVVDDSPIVRSLIVAMFNELDYHVETAENGFEGYKAVESFNPDIITSDYDMPVLDGWQFCSEVRDHEKYKDIPIIMITTRANELDLKKGDLLGVSAYLTKPFSKDQLKDAIEAAMRNAKIKKEQETIAKFMASDTLKSINNMIDGSYIRNGEDKFITVLFADMCAFSLKCEKYSASKIVLLLNTYFDLMVDILFEHGAIIDKFIGDAIVARFDSGNTAIDARNAVYAAWRMHEKLIEFNKESFEEIQIRIGINSGRVILGNLGSERHRLEYAMIGDNVNIGQRLESSAPDRKCMISEATYSLIKEKVLVGERQEIKVKGKSELVSAYILEGIKAY